MDKKSSSLMLFPFMEIISFGSLKNGELNKPTLYPFATYAFAIYVTVLPFPFVPVTCMDGMS